MHELHRRRRDVHRVELLAQRLDDDAVVVEVAGDERLAQGGARQLEPARAQVDDRRHPLDGDLLPRELLDVAQHAVLARLGERDRDALASRAPRPADAVDVGVGRRGDVEVDDVREVLDVEPARGDVGRDEEVGGPLAEAAHDAVALLLREPAVQRLRAVAAPGQRLGELVDLGARAAEDDRRRRRLHVEDAAERRHLVLARDDVRRLPDARDLPRCGLLPRDRHPRRLVEVPLGEGADARRHRRREERRLALLGERAEDRLEVLGEAHVEHLVGLVEDDGAHAGEVERAAVDVVEGAPRRRDDDVDAPLEPAQLLLDRLAAVDREHPGAELAPVLVQRLGDLHGELAGRHEDEPAHGTAAVLVGGLGGRGDALEHREGEGGGLPGAGRRLAEQVAPPEELRDRLALDRRRLLVAERRERPHDGFAQPERGEAGGAVGGGGAGIGRCRHGSLRRRPRARARKDTRAGAVPRGRQGLGRPSTPGRVSRARRARECSAAAHGTAFHADHEDPERIEPRGATGRTVTSPDELQI